MWKTSQEEKEENVVKKGRKRAKKQGESPNGGRNALDFPWKSP